MNKVVAVIGAGPAGIFAAQALAEAGVHVALFNRDIKPGGLAEYGIFFDKYKMKNGLRKQFQRVLAHPNITYFGNVTVGEEGELTLADLQELGFHALLVTVGAQGTKWLGTTGENLQGVYHAKDLVYHYNKLPPFAEQVFGIGRKVAIIGAGNVMIDIANWLIRYLHVDEVIAIVRRDPSAVKFDPTPTFPQNGISYEAYNLPIEEPIEGVFLAGWAREASTGLVGAARKDGMQGAQAVLSYLDSAELPSADPEQLFAILKESCPNHVCKDGWQRLVEIETARAAADALPEFKFPSNDAMLLELQ